MGKFHKKGRKKFLHKKKIFPQKSHKKSFKSIFVILRKNSCHLFFWFSKKDLFDLEAISSSFPLPETIGDRFMTRNNGKENITSFERWLFIDAFLRFFLKNWPDIGRIIWTMVWKVFFFRCVLKFQVNELKSQVHPKFSPENPFVL